MHKSRPGVTPCGFIRDCRFPSSVACSIINRRAAQRFRVPVTRKTSVEAQDRQRVQVTWPLTSHRPDAPKDKGVISRVHEELLWQ
jgi:hypothetical protein